VHITVGLEHGLSMSKKNLLTGKVMCRKPQHHLNVLYKLLVVV
jgi:hypothetical protein